MALLGAMVLTACGSDSVTGPQTPEGITYAASLGVTLSAMTQSASGLYTRDLVVGTGATAVKGKTVAMHYHGWLSDGTLFDANTSASPFTFVLGNNTVPSPSVVREGNAKVLKRALVLNHTNNEDFVFVLLSKN